MFIKVLQRNSLQTTNQCKIIFIGFANNGFANILREKKKWGWGESLFIQYIYFWYFFTFHFLCFIRLWFINVLCSCLYIMKLNKLFVNNFFLCFCCKCYCLNSFQFKLINSITKSIYSHHQHILLSNAALCYLIYSFLKPVRCDLMEICLLGLAGFWRNV